MDVESQMVRRAVHEIFFYERFAGVLLFSLIFINES